MRARDLGIAPSAPPPAHRGPAAPLPRRLRRANRPDSHHAVIRRCEGRSDRPDSRPVGIRTIQALRGALAAHLA
jgi:hypothetical protein